MADSATYEPNLRHPATATQNFTRFCQSISIDAARHTSVHEAGLTRYVQLTQHYIVDPANTVDGTLLPRPGNVRPILPANPTAVSIASYNIFMTDYNSINASISAIVDKILNGLCPATLQVVNDRATTTPGFFQRPWLLLEAIFEQHGIISAEHISQAKNVLITPFNRDNDNLASYRVNIQGQHQFLSDASHAVNEGDKIAHYESAMRQYPDISATILLYKNSTLFAFRTFAAMTAYVEIHAPDQTSTTIDMGYVNNATVKLSPNT